MLAGWTTTRTCGQADDGIDRYDGFGRDVVVESLAVVDGQHGAELLVTFAVVLPPDATWRSVPERGTVRLPFDREWRRLSNYSAPPAYAPVVAAQVMTAAHAHVERHRAGPARSEGRDSARASLPDRPAQREVVLDALGRQGRVVEVSPDRLEVHVPGEHDDDDPEVVTFVVTADEWEEVLASVAGGDLDLYVDELLGPRDDDEHVVVFHDGDLVRSTREQLPPVRGRAFARRMAELGSRRPGGWFSYAAVREDEA